MCVILYITVAMLFGIKLFGILEKILEWKYRSDRWIYEDIFIYRIGYIR